MVMKRIKWFLPLLCLSFIVGCSNDFKDPEKVIRAYYQAVFSSNKFDKAYKYLSSESQRHADLNEFREDLTETFPNVTRQITQLNILPEDKEHPAYRRVKITFDQTVDGNSTKNEVRYYTLIKENNNWKIAWSSPTLANLYKKRDEGLYSEAIKLAEEILSIDPYNAGAYDQMAYCYYRLNNPEKSVANVRKLNALLPENNLINFLNDDIKNDSFGGCFDSDDACLYSKISTYFKTWDINIMVKSSNTRKYTRFEQAWAILKSIKPNIKENKYTGLVEMIGDKEIKIVIENHEFDKAWEALKLIKQDITESKYKEIAKMINEEQNKPISTGIADFEESWRKYMGRNVTISGYLSLYQGYGAGLPAIYQICEKTFHEGLCFQNITILKDVSTNVDSVELRRKFKEMSDNSEGLYVTITGKVRKYMGVANEYEVYEITFR